VATRGAGTRGNLGTVQGTAGIAVTTRAAPAILAAARTVRARVGAIGTAMPA
jgi:hypothetical protein